MAASTRDFESVHQMFDQFIYAGFLRSECFNVSDCVFLYFRFTFASKLNKNLNACLIFVSLFKVNLIISLQIINLYHTQPIATDNNIKIFTETLLVYLSKCILK